MGLPAAIKNDPRLGEIFALVGKAAWLASQRQSATLASAEEAVKDIKNEKEDECDFNFNLIPEVIAEVVGYARSPLRDEGLHLLVDIGASTLDVCSFRLADEGGEDHYSILTADVKLLGAKHLHGKRVEGLKRAIEDHAKSLSDPTDPLYVIEDDVKSYIPPPDALTEQLAIAEKEFVGKCVELLKKTFEALKKRRDPDSRRWSEDFPIFLCGGAKEMTIYKEVVSDIEKWLVGLVHWFRRSPTGVRRINLPKPKSLAAEIDDNFHHRLAVAYGLSHQSYNIGAYEVPGEIEDLPPSSPPKRDIDDNYVSKDMV